MVGIRFTSFIHFVDQLIFRPFSFYCKFILTSIFLIIFFGPKFFRTKSFWIQNILDHIFLAFKIFRTQNLFWAKMFCYQNFFVTKKFSRQEIFWNQNLFASKKMSDLKIFLDPKLFLTQIFYSRSFSHNIWLNLHLQFNCLSLDWAPALLQLVPLHTFKLNSFFSRYPDK